LKENIRFGPYVSAPKLRVYPDVFREELSPHQNVVQYPYKTPPFVAIEPYTVSAEEHFSASVFSPNAGTAKRHSLGRPRAF
jgi:hypothetical protein